MAAPQRERSPSYPSTDLATALASTEAIYKAERRSVVPMISAAKDLGFKSLSGPTRTRLATLRQFGLIEWAGKGDVRVSDRAIDLLLRPKGSVEYQELLQEIALEPPIFRELFEGFRDASEHTLRHYLVTQKRFSEEGAERLIRAFRATLAFAKLSGERYDEGTRQDLSGDADPEFGRWADDGAGQQKPPPRGTVVQNSWMLSPNLSADLTLRGGKVTRPALERLRKQIDLLIDALTMEEEADDQPESMAAMRPQTPGFSAHLNTEARELLAKADIGGVPLYQTENLTRIARENGVSVLPDMTPNEIIDHLRQRA